MRDKDGRVWAGADSHTVTLLLFRPPFAFLRSPFVLALTFHRPSRRQEFAMVPQV